MMTPGGRGAIEECSKLCGAPMDHGTGERPMVVALNRQAKVPDRVGRF
jgi:hypothetical protein